MLKKTLLLLVLAAIVACYFIFDLGQYLNLEYLQTQKDTKIVPVKLPKRISTGDGYGDRNYINQEKTHQK